LPAAENRITKDLSCGGVGEALSFSSRTTERQSQ
jgi:hypothetical protein